MFNTNNKSLGDYLAIIPKLRMIRLSSTNMRLLTLHAIIFLQLSHSQNIFATDFQFPLTSFEEKNWEA